MKPTAIEIQELSERLIEEFNISNQLVNELITQYSSLEDVQLLFDTKITRVDKVKLLLNLRGSQIFAGSSVPTIKLRKKILSALQNSEIDKLFDRYCQSKGKTREHKIRKLAELKWFSGKGWTIAFIKASGLPEIFTGVKPPSKLAKFEDVEPFLPPPKLTDFQIELKEKLLGTLMEEGDNARCVISLPTGGGKTRTAVEAFIEWLQPRFSSGVYLIWIAQSEELCEQAIACIMQLWASKEFSSPLRIYRFFGGRELNTEDMMGGVVVASIQQLDRRVDNDEVLKKIVNKLGAVIIDEAHRATSKMYDYFFEFCSSIRGEDLYFPVCGLTATPGRAFGNTAQLVDRFNSTLFTPTINEGFHENPLEYFRAEGYLARAQHKQVYTNIDIPIQGILFETPEQFENRMDKEVIPELAKNPNRNRLILRELLEVPDGQLVIVYACTVKHAEMLSTALNYVGKNSVSISADTPKHYRRHYLDQFKKGEIQYVINFGVLTTGFDAPKTEHIFICRPTFSDVLYEQIVGRGLRGPKFGGTETCQIVDFTDNYERFGGQQAYHRFKDFW